jgi:sulfite exporter TauE/SafE
MSTTLLWTAFVLGLTGSLHCAGMCGPIALILPFNELHGVRKLMGIVLYHLGRLMAYAALAVAMRSFAGLFHPDWQRYVSIGIGVAFLVLGIVSLISRGRWATKMPWQQLVMRGLSATLQRSGLPALLAAGFLNGLLPCGMVYLAVSNAVTAPGPIGSAAAMMAFGAGTLPMLLAFSWAQGHLSIVRRRNVQKLVPVVMIAFGLLFSIRGMNLGIPYLSPKLEQQGHTVKAHCCHK